MEDLFTEGTWNAEFAEQVEQKETDIILTNREGSDAFLGTGLAEILENNNIASLFVGGFLSNLCVEETILAASDIESVSIYGI